MNTSATCFLGAGAYEHHIPAAVWEITTRGEITVYELSFPDDENMVWSIRRGDKVVPAFRWRR